MKPQDGRRANCPLCGCGTGFGNLTGHVGSDRCLAQAQRAGVVFDCDQKVLLDRAQGLREAIRRAVYVNKTNQGL